MARKSQQIKKRKRQARAYERAVLALKKATKGYKPITFPLTIENWVAKCKLQLERTAVHIDCFRQYLTQ